MKHDQSGFLHRYRHVAGAVLLILGILVGVVVAVQMRSLPPLPPDPEIQKTIDALFTAVTSRNEQRLKQCTERLDAYRDEQRLPAEAAEYLQGVIQSARAGKWDSAARRLYKFIEES